jgi:hypothetical protein
MCDFFRKIEQILMKRARSLQHDFAIGIQIMTGLSISSKRIISLSSDSLQLWKAWTSSVGVLRGELKGNGAMLIFEILISLFCSTSDHRANMMKRSVSVFRPHWRRTSIYSLAKRSARIDSSGADGHNMKNRFMMDALARRRGFRILSVQSYDRVLRTEFRKVLRTLEQSTGIHNNWCLNILVPGYGVVSRLTTENWRASWRGRGRRTSEFRQCEVLNFWSISSERGVFDGFARERSELLSGFFGNSGIAGVNGVK